MTFLVLVTAAAVVTGLASGVMFAFSTFVMGGLRRLPAVDGAAAMRAFNVEAVRLPLMSLLAATALLPVAATAAGFVSSGPGRFWALAGAVIALLGIHGVTGVGNVPWNDRLAASTDPAATWERFVGAWLRWNHVRTLAGTVATALLVVAGIAAA